MKIKKDYLLTYDEIDLRRSKKNNNDVTVVNDLKEVNLVFYFIL